MKLKQLIYLAKLSLAQRKKSSRSIIAGIAVSLIIIIPIIVLLVGVNNSVTKELNKMPYLLSGGVNMADYRVESEDSQNNLSGSKHISFIDKLDDDASAIVYETAPLCEYNNVFSGNIENNIYYQLNENAPIKAKSLVANMSEVKKFLSIIDGKSNTYFPKNLTDNYNGGIFIDGCDKGFTGGGKGQVILSEQFLIDNGLSARDVYGAQLTLRNEQINYDDTTKEETGRIINGCYFINYEVVGIVRKEIFALYGDLSFANRPFMQSYMFFTEDSVYDEIGAGVLKPYYVADGGGRKLVYDNYENREQLNKEYMMLGLEENFFDVHFAYANNNQTLMTTGVYLEAEDYASLAKTIATVESLISRTGSAETVISGTYRKYSMLYETVNMASTVFCIVGLIVFLVAVINLYISINRHVRSRTHYLTMLRAIGAQDGDIPKISITETTILLSKAMAFVLTIGTAICVGIKLIIDRQIKSMNIVTGVTLGWGSILLTIFAFCALVFTVGLIFSIANTYKLSKKSISQVLSGSR